MISNRFRAVAVVLSSICIVMPALVMAAPAVVAAKQVEKAHRDISLHKGGVLVGQFLNAQGIGVAGKPVSVRTAGQEIARVTTDKDGKFTISGLKGGVHQVATAEQQGVYRLWAPQTAPPAARQGLMLVSSSDVVRAQCDCGTPVCGSACGNGYGGGAFGGGGGGIGNWMANHPLLTAGAIGAAIAIPLAVDDDDNPPGT